MPAKADRAAPYSLRRRLMVAMTAGFVAVLSVISVGLWTYARDAANETYDLLLQGSAISILERATLTPAGFALDFPPSALEILGLAENDRVFYRVFDAAGATITGDPGLPLPPGFQATEDPRMYDARHSGETVRFVVQGRTLPGLDEPRWVLVQVGQTRAARDSLQLNIFSTGLVGLSVLAIVSFLFVRLAIARAMRPLSGLEADIRTRQPTDLSPLEAAPPREIESLITAINDFMRRLDTSKDNAQSFIADVTHQMRTALATLDGHLQIAEARRDPETVLARLEKARDQAKRTIHLTNQLLSHALVIHRADDYPREPVALKSLVRSVVEEAIRDPRGARAAFQFSDAACPGDATVPGDPLTLREALMNLVQNALSHAGARPRIRISLEPARLDAGPAVSLIVEDDGPGIAPARRARAVQRFESHGPGAGSGIGLAIVKAVAESHGGRLRLETAPGGGLAAAIDLPAADAKETAA